jgi:DNA topoisomerase-3
MQLFIAEKPELAKAIVAALGGGQRHEGYYHCGENVVTWCYGHMLQLFDPEDYNERYKQWTLNDLPIVNIPWRRKPADDDRRRGQLKTIIGLLTTANSVVHAGDPDEEGQLLVDEILAYADCRLPVKRLLINDNNIKVVRRQLASMRPNADFAGLSAAAEARSVADQLYGFNLTRGYTLAARAKGYTDIVSVGRVQTPILGLVVRRCRENAGHKPGFYYEVRSMFKFDQFDFPATYKCVQTDPVDDEGRLNKLDRVQQIVDAARGQVARLVDRSVQRSESPPPLPYNLLNLQIDASRKFGLKPHEVKAITQTLRERYSLISYNRSDCKYLSTEQHDDAAAVLAAIAGTAPHLSMMARRADPMLCGRAFDSSRVTAHHAIIPTEAVVNISRLSEPEQNIYTLIARAYIAQFCPKSQSVTTEVLIDVAGNRFFASSTATTLGWKELYAGEPMSECLSQSMEDGQQDLHKLAPGQAGTCLSVTLDRHQTRPPPLYTIPSLLYELTDVAKYIRDDHLRKVLVKKDGDNESERGGIGTPATRDTILKSLFDRGYLAEKQQNIIVTSKGEDLYDALPDIAKFPDMTAIWHEQQKMISAGTYDVNSFIQQIVKYISEEIAVVKQQGFDVQIDTSPCPNCGQILRRLKNKNKKSFFWGCIGFAQGCTFTCSDSNGNPSLNGPPQRSFQSQRRRRLDGYK